MARLIADVLGEVFEVDGRMFRTLRLLFGRPGVLTREYLAGRRQRYTPPLRLYLVVSLLFFVTMSWAAGRGLLLEEGETLGTDAPEQARLLADELPRLMFLLLPAFAVLLKAAFPRRLYFDHLIYSLHFHSAAFVALAVVVPLDAMANRHWFPLLLQLGAFGYLIHYFMASLRRVYEAGWGRVVGAGVGIFLVYLVLLTLAVELRHAGGP